VRQSRIIEDIQALEIIDNRGRPTLRVKVEVGEGCSGTADVPCGSSTGPYEAVEVRDGGRRYGGWGVQNAVEAVRERLRPELVGWDATCQRGLDLEMVRIDGTGNKSSVGANAILGVSLAVARSAALSCGLPLYRYLSSDAHVLPVPAASLINGGLHAANELDLQEICVLPVGAGSMAEAMCMLSEIFYALRDVLGGRVSGPNFGEDGGFAPAMSSTREGLDALSTAVERAGYGGSVSYFIDFAAGGLYEPAAHRYRLDGKKRTTEDMIVYFKDLVREYPDVVAIEDPLYYEDFAEWHALGDELPGTLIVGDDLYATNVGRLRLGVESCAANALLCKVNQIGTLTETMDAARFAERNGHSVVMSARSGETEDAILSDICVALNAGLFKIGGLHGSDRGAKYNRLLEIENELGRAATYAGTGYRRLV